MLGRMSFLEKAEKNCIHESADGGSEGEGWEIYFETRITEPEVDRKGNVGRPGLFTAKKLELNENCGVQRGFKDMAGF
jgi:hypothetical protein